MYKSVNTTNQSKNNTEEKKTNNKREITETVRTKKFKTTKPSLTRKSTVEDNQRKRAIQRRSKQL